VGIILRLPEIDGNKSGTSLRNQKLLASKKSPFKFIQ